MALDKGNTERYRTHYKERMKKSFKDANKAIQDEISEGLYVKSPRGRMLKNLMPDILTGTAFEDVRRLWKEQSEEVITSANIKDKDTLTKLNQIVGRYEKQLVSITGITTKYIIEIRRMHGGKLTETALLKMRDSLAFKARTLSKLLLNPKNSGAINSIKYAFKLETQTAEKFAEVKKYLSKSFASGGPECNQGEAASSWLIMNFLSEKEREEVLKDHIAKEKLTGENLKEFLKAGSKHGAISFTLASKLTGKNSRFTKGEEHMMSTTYKINHDFVKRGKSYFRSAYGSYNPAAQMLTGKNILIALTKLSVAVSVGGTLVANIFKGGGWKDPEKLAQIMTKKGMLINYAAYALAKYKEDPKPGFWTDASERREQDKNETAYQLKTLTEGNRGWNIFLTAQKFAGSTVFEEFVNEHGRRSKDTKNKTTKVTSVPVYRKITLQSFVRWLKSKGKKDGKYSNLLKQISVSANGTYKINGYETNNDDIRKLAKAYHVWNISGNKAQSRYKDAIQRAGGGTKVQKKKKT
ncbi:MAG: hypothetical protein ABID64_01950 [Nitrospirota bacterium]